MTYNKKELSKLRSDSCKRAVAMYNASKSLTWGECMKRAWAAEKMLFKLRMLKVVCFSFYKKDPKNAGKFVLRDAVGTLRQDAYPMTERPKGTGTAKVNPFIVKYYDHGSKGWRSFHVARLAA